MAVEHTILKRSLLLKSKLVEELNIMGFHLLEEGGMARKHVGYSASIDLS